VTRIHCAAASAVARSVAATAASTAPRCRTLGRANRVWSSKSLPKRYSGVFQAVRTAWTPGRRSASLVSTASTRACACSLRRSFPCRRPGRCKSAANFPLPSTFSRVSMRGTDVPTTCPITLPPSLRYPANLNWVSTMSIIPPFSLSPRERGQENVRHDICGGALIQAHVLHDTPGPSPGPRPYDVEITAGVAPDAMTRAEAGITPLRQALAFQGQDAHQAAVVLRDIDDVVSIHV